MAFTVSSCVPRQTVLGEGVRWDAARRELLWVDIAEGRLMRQAMTDGPMLEDRGELALDRPLGSVAPVAGEDSWLAAAGRGFVRLEPGGSLAPVAELAPIGHRVNDANVDAAGRAYVGTMSESQESGAGALHRLDRDGRVVRLLDGLTVPNGIDWSPDQSTMYLVESSPGLVWAFPFDFETGALGKRRTLLEAAAETGGVPDGLTVDRDGDLWVAFYGGGAVRRYRPDGTLREVIHLPAVQATSCAFGGDALDTLFVSSASEGYDEARRAREPLAGTLLRVDGLDATGVPARPFQPLGDWWQRLGGA
jgi:sugar lactone lactonase YvrE